MLVKPTLGTSDKTPRNGRTNGTVPADFFRAPPTWTGLRGSTGTGTCAGKLCAFVLIEWISFPFLPGPDLGASNRRVRIDLASDVRESRRQMLVALLSSARCAGDRKSLACAQTPRREPQGGGPYRSRLG